MYISHIQTRVLCYVMLCWFEICAVFLRDGVEEMMRNASWFVIYSF